MNVRGTLLVGLLLLHLTTVGQARTWSDRTGKYQVEAEFVQLADGVVKLKRPDGKEITVPLARLSPDDQEVARQAADKVDARPAAESAQVDAPSRPAVAQPVVKKNRPQPPANLDPELAKKFLTQIFFKNEANVRAMLAEEPGLVNCDLNGETPLIKACSAESLDMVKLLAEAGADVTKISSTGNTALHDAVMRTDLDVVKFLISAGADPVAAAGEGYTPLHRAATKEIAELLLSYKADIHALTEHNDTPLHSTLDMGFLEVAELLIEQGADVEAVGRWDATPLHVVCRTPMGDAKAMAEMLIMHKANVHARGFLDATLIHSAAFYDKPELVELFAEKGVDINAKDRLGKTALDAAKTTKYQPRIDLLKRLGAKD